MKKAEWGLDSVVVALNDTNLDDFTGIIVQELCSFYFFRHEEG